MEIVELKAEARPGTGKRGAKECRKKGLLPGIFYGRDDEALSLAVDPKELDQVLHTHAGGNVIIKLTISERGGEAPTVVVKELQIDNIKDEMLHVDFCHISLDRKIRTTIPFKMVGESPGVKEGGILEHLLWELEIESLPMEVPDCVEVDVSALSIGDVVAVAELTVPEGITVLTDPKIPVAAVAAPRVEVEPEVAPEAELEEGAEPEVIGEKAEKEGAEGEPGDKAAGEKQKPEKSRKSKE